MKNITFAICTFLHVSYSYCQLYVDTTTRIPSVPCYNVGALGGVWIPTGEISKLGIHPSFGMQAGFKFSKFTTDISVAFQFLKAPENYMARRERSSELDETNHFFGGYFGLDLGYDIKNVKTNSYRILLGGGLDGFDVFPETKDSEVVSIWALNINFGFGYRKYLNESMYFNSQIKCNLLDYSRSGLIDYKGFPITVEIGLGALTEFFN
ncbi:MAG: hypothetical protein JXB49_10340 [Bacteroidales bacterium]|nr:hypothetical protein [Bacteroidales bacterium]